MPQWLHACSASVKQEAMLLALRTLLKTMALFSLAAAVLLAQASPLMIPAKNGSTCPGGTSYAGAGYCKVRGNVQYFPASNGSTCPGGSSYAGAGYCKVRQ